VLIAMLDPTYPGVYIEEISTGGPIAGVGTSTAAFIGPALKGPYFTPVRITNWTEFQRFFGGYKDGAHMAHGVHGFFDNGGTIAYIVRVGTGVRAHRDLIDRGSTPGKAFRVESKLEGADGNSVAVSVSDAELAKTTVQKERVAVKSVVGKVATLADPDDAAKFRVGDTVTVENTEFRGDISSIERDTLMLDTAIAQQAGEGFLRIADIVPGQTRLRLASTRGIEPGSVIKIARARTSETQVVSGIAGSFVALAGSGLKNGLKLAAEDGDVNVTSLEFSLRVTGPRTGDSPETFDGLSMDRRHSRHWEKAVKSAYVDLMPASAESAEPAPNNRPAVAEAASLEPATGDSSTDPGLPEYTRGIASLVPIMDVQLICAPDGTTQPIQQEIIRHCEMLGDRFAILDAEKGLPPDKPLLAQRAWCVSPRGFASLYYPWLSITNPATGEGQILVPPSGHVAGIFARVDAQRGVHKAPANEYIASALGLETIVDNVQHGILNRGGVNVLRVFPGEVRPLVWGVRTTSDGTEWMHNSVRRLFIFVETSLKLGLRPWVFEPNNLGLWKKIDRTITEFLTRVWRSGALFGRKASEAFYVKIDEELNPPAVRALGQVFIEVGMAPVHPAEFIVVRIGIWDGGASISEI
jgi:phage tail sheath protein FI